MLVITGTIAAVAVPRIGDFHTRARVQSLAESVRRANMKIVDEWAAEGEFPDTPDAAWFAQGEPQHTLLAGESGVEVVDDRSKEHPDPLIWASGADPWWYNAANGLFRARVPAQASQGATLALYNYVNGTNVLVQAGGEKGSSLLDPADLDGSLGIDGDGEGDLMRVIRK